MEKPESPDQASPAAAGGSIGNRLAAEKSPYLLQHAANPVDWYPWGEEAFRTAAKEDKPVLLSIGYSTCHWCHVMARESFEDEGVARVLNESFVCIKVDREERPDIDAVYMAVCQMMTGTGGWPLTIILTPDKKPFFAATYLPKESRFGMTGLLDLLPRIASLWKERRQDLLAASDTITSALADSVRQESSKESSEQDLLNAGYEELQDRFDPDFGGFGPAPKFPAPHTLMFLLRYWKRTGTPRALDMVMKTLDALRSGGIYDHVGGGIHRYSTDAKWHVPHFEKMLYDQALLAIACIETFQATTISRYQKTAEEILGYVLRDMTSVNGSFFSAEDADTGGREGAFYLWDAEELQRVLGRDDGVFAQAVFSVPDPGDIPGPLRCGNGTVLHQTVSARSIAERFSLTPEEVASRIESVLNTLFAARQKRPRPARDEKVLADWNGLMIAGLSKAAQAFDNPAFATAAGRAADFVLSSMRTPDGGLYHRYSSGEAAILGFAADYAGMVYGLTEVYEATFDERYLVAAGNLTDHVLAHFNDAEKGGFFTTSDNGEQVLVRTKEIHDGAGPSSNSLIFYNLLRLFRLTGIAEYEQEAARLSASLRGIVRNAPSAHAFCLCALDYATGKPAEVVIAGVPARADTRDVIRACRRGFHPSLVVRVREIETGDRKPPYHNLPAERYPAIGGRATAYLCSRQACSFPVTDPEELENLLNQNP